MNTPLPPTPANPSDTERGGSINGKWLVAATLSLFLIVPLTVYALMIFWVYPAQEARQQEPPFVLQWSDRHHWPVTPIQRTTLERGTMSSARTHQRYFPLPFDPGLEARRAIAVAENAARRISAAVQAGHTPEPALGPALEALCAAWPDLFYPRYVLGVWQHWANQPEASEASLTEAFHLADAALLQRYTSPAARPAANHLAAPFTVVYDRVDHDVLLQDMVMHYPPLPTNAVGAVYFPVYRMLYRIPAADLPPGVISGEVNAEWFAFAGPCGELPRKQVKPAVQAP